MITDAIVSFIGNVLSTVVSPLPTWTPLDFNTLGSTFVVFKWLHWLNFYLPVDGLITILGLIYAAMGALLTVRATLWVLSKIHITGGDSD